MNTDAISLYNKAKGHQLQETTGNVLYDACVWLCQWQGIEPVSLDILCANSSRQFTPNDFARLSGFICRDIILDEKWFKQDAGPLLAFYKSKKNPVVCFPKKNGKYIMWNPADNSIVRVTAQIAAELSPKAVIFYRPFPKEKITFEKLVLFAIQDINWRDIISILVFALLGTLIGLWLPYFNEKLYNLFIPLKDVSGLWGVGAVVAACFLGNISFTVVRNLSNFRVINRMKYSVQAAVFDRIFNLPENFFKEYDTADLGKRAIGISEVFSTLVSTAVNTVLTAIFSLVYLWKMFDYSQSLSLITILILIVAMGILVILGWRGLKFEKEQLEIESHTDSMLFQFLKAISKLRVAGANDRALQEYMQPYADLHKLNMQKEKCSLLMGIFSGVINIVFYMIFYYMIIHNRMEIGMGAFMGFATAFGLFSSSMISVVSGYLKANAVAPALERIKPILETLPEQQDGAVMPDELTGEIEVSNVTFSYNSCDREMPPVLKELSFCAKTGEYIGIVGPSGCGKTTLLKLILGFEKPQLGRIYFDETDIDTINKRELRKRLGVVLQNGELITGSIYDNITINAPYATSQQVEQAVSIAGLERDIADMPMGLQTIVSEGDGFISAGQRQRILIARAIVGQPKAILFDEATSALDNATQSSVCEKLGELKCTRIVIAHRLSTIIHCDRILVMDEGRIVEEGNYEQLMEKKGLFYTLASRQIS